MPKTHACAREGCAISCPIKNKYCSDACLTMAREARRIVKPPKPPKETPVEKQAKLEDRFLSMAADYLKTHPGRSVKLSPARVKKSHASPHEMVLCLSDAHYPEVVDPQVAMGLTYNGDVCVRRLERIRDVTLRYKQLRESSYPIRKLTVAMLGDMLSGDIHEELEVTNQMPLAEALVKLAYYVHDMCVSFAKEFPAVELVVLPGNHPRQFKKPRFKQKTITNFEYILGHFIASLSRGAYTVNVPKDLVYVHPVFGYRIGMTHGDGVKSNSFAGIPFYGIKQRQDALQSLLRHLGADGIDYLLMGHFHRGTIMEGTDSTVIINGAVKGGDEYSLGSRLSSNEPMQYLLTFHEKHGLTDASRINLGAVV